MWPKWEENKPFSVALLILIAYAIVFLWVTSNKSLLETAQIGKPVPYEHSIYIEGTGRASATPDLATVSYSVESRDADQANAQEDNSQKGNALLEIVKGLGIASADIQTDNYNVYQDCRWDQETNVCVPTDWVVTQSVTVKVRNTEQVPAVLTALGQNEASSVSGPNYTVDDPTAAKAEAREKAIADAMGKAKGIADSLGVRIERVIGYSEYADQPVPYYGKLSADAGMGGASTPPSLEVGTQDISLTVSITYKLVE